MIDIAQYAKVALLARFVIRGCAAITTTHTEDLSQFSRGPEMCPGRIEALQAPMPVSCADPACQGISWAVPPYRCRQHDGIMFGREVFGCRCCPRLIDCDDPKCAGNAHDEICRSELLSNCICVSSHRRVLTSAPLDEISTVQVDYGLADVTLSESLNNDIEAITTSRRSCPRDPSVRCLDPQCRGSDDWKGETSTTPRCNLANGKLDIDGIETILHGCSCCPEYIACSSSDCNGDATQACTSVPLKGCFCNWPRRGRQLVGWAPAMDDGSHVLMNTVDAAFDDPEFNPFGGQISSTTAIRSTASTSMSYEARPLATERRTAPAPLQNLAWIDFLSRRQEASLNSSILVITGYSKCM